MRNEIMEEKLKKPANCELLPCLLTHDWLRVLWLSRWLILVRRNGVIRHGGKESVASAGQSGCQGCRDCQQFFLIVSRASLMGAPRLHGGSTTILAGWASILPGTSIGGWALRFQSASTASDVKYDLTVPARD